jgi:hypothetical protein
VGRKPLKWAGLHLYAQPGFQLPPHQVQTFRNIGNDLAVFGVNTLGNAKNKSG